MKYSILFFALMLISCKPETERLPILGEPTIIKGKKVYPKIGDFSFTDQDGKIITNQTFEGKIYVADFIFLSCPTICPIMNQELKKVYAVYQNNAKVNFLSHTIDPEHDTVEQLRNFKTSQRLNDHWYFVTGKKERIFEVAKESYFTTAYPDEKEPGGLVHGGGFLLVDHNRHIRGVYDGTNPEETKRLINDIRILLKELMR
ncbi:SCO family protein [Flavobacterium sp.]|uniref:SCO family protein n=1 Tax=Flavobacterium sp. TaxID=239 RepID=UPI0033424E62